MTGRAGRGDVTGYAKVMLGEGPRLLELKEEGGLLGRFVCKAVCLLGVFLTGNAKGRSWLVSSFLVTWFLLSSFLGGSCS